MPANSANTVDLMNATRIELPRHDKIPKQLATPFQSLKLLANGKLVCILPKYEFKSNRNSKMENKSCFVLPSIQHPLDGANRSHSMEIHWTLSISHSVYLKCANNNLNIKYWFGQRQFSTNIWPTSLCKIRYTNFQSHTHTHIYSNLSRLLNRRDCQTRFLSLTFQWPNAWEWADLFGMHKWKM